MSCAGVGRVFGAVCAGSLALAVAGGCGGSVVAGGSPDDGSPGDAGGFYVVGVMASGADADDGASSEDLGSGDDAGNPTCTGTRCPSPASVSGFVSTWKPPTGAHRGACSPDLIDQFYTECLSPSGDQACASFGTSADAAHAACAQCLKSSYGDSQWAALVYTPWTIDTNGPGCIALTDPTWTACAQAMEADGECAHAACDTVCSGDGSASFDQWVTCSAAANSCGCAAEFAALDCQKQLLASHSPARACLLAQTFGDSYYAIAPVFCGD
ncbi:MAG: hypothetical protein ACRENE_08660 [Polyangiaceae bacterium]